MRVYGAATTPLSSYTLIVGGYTKRDLLSFRGYLNFLLSLLSDACFEIDIFHDNVNDGVASTSRPSRPRCQHPCDFTPRSQLRNYTRSKEPSENGASVEHFCPTVAGESPLVAGVGYWSARAHIARASIGCCTVLNPLRFGGRKWCVVVNPFGGSARYSTDYQNNHRLFARKRLPGNKLSSGRVATRRELGAR